MKLSTKGMRVIITAAASGIGRTVAETFLENDAKIYICDIDEDQLEDCTNSMQDIGAMRADVSDALQAEVFFREAKAYLGGIDILINNAGISGPSAPVEKISPEEWNQTMAVNINGQFYCARLAVPQIKASGGGSIINMSSAAGLYGYPLRSPYVTSKWAVIGLTKTMAMELGKFGIRVNAICPTSVEGPRIDAVIEREAQSKGITEEAVRDGLIRGTFMRTFLNARDIANMILFLCSEAGQMISGQAFGFVPLGAGIAGGGRNNKV
jgi:NAD(P)-dependent dehydrogenase (short-subunit alcohol dehydrogenase family)